MLVEFWDLAFHDFLVSRIQLSTVSCYIHSVLTAIQTFTRYSDTLRCDAWGTGKFDLPSIWSQSHKEFHWIFDHRGNRFIRRQERQQH